MAVIMETDRINHFFWDHKENGEFHKEFIDFYGKLDEFIGEINRRLHEDDELIIASDHGFCDIKQEINIQRWFERNNYTKYIPSPTQEML